VLLLIMRARNGTLRRACLGLAFVGAAGCLIVAGIPDLRTALTERMEERGPVEFREAVYAGAWQMFLERPLTGWGVNQMPAELAHHVTGYKERDLYPHNTYLELLVEHGIAGLALYAWLMWEIWRLGRGSVPRRDSTVFLNRDFQNLWPLILGVYWINAALVVMNYQFVNGLLFTVAGMLAGQRRQTGESVYLPQHRPETAL
jgi:O-antigen ligase